MNFARSSVRKFRLNGWFALALLGLLFVLPSPDVRAASIAFTAANLADTTADEALWKYEYPVTDFTFSGGQGFSVFFNFNLYTTLQSPPPAVNGDWSLLTIQPDLALSSNGFPDAQAPRSSRHLPINSLRPFFGKGKATPGSQPFTFYDAVRKSTATPIQAVLAAAPMVTDPQDAVKEAGIPSESANLTGTAREQSAFSAESSFVGLRGAIEGAVRNTYGRSTDLSDFKTHLAELSASEPSQAASAAGPISLGPPSARIAFEATDLSDTTSGQDLWRYDYTVSDFAFAAGQGFTISFDLSLYRLLQSPPPGVNSDWSVLTIQPDLALNSNGFYDGQALRSAPSLADKFSVTFVWLGTGAPTAQPFNLYDTNFSTIYQGNTIPEPNAATLFVFCGLALSRFGMRARHRRVALVLRSRNPLNR